MTDPAIRPLRTVLYMPGSNARALDKARTLDCDGVILDLEDAVAPDAKDQARTLVAQALSEGGFGHRFMIVRVNASGTPWHDDDMAFVKTLNADAILIPKINSAQDVYEARATLGDGPLWAMMETPLAMLNAQEIASAGLAGLVMGTNDLAKDTGARLIPGRAPMLAWLSTCVAAARAYGLTILDGVFNSIEDPEGFVAECDQALNLGMDGKTVLHPSQIAPCNAIFAPDTKAVESARAIIAAFNLPENADKGAIRLDGKMVERLHAQMAAKTVAMADAIAQRG